VVLFIEELVAFAGAAQPRLADDAGAPEEVDDDHADGEAAVEGEIDDDEAFLLT
jgi:hypothetical protein